MSDRDPVTDGPVDGATVGGWATLPGFDADPGPGPQVPPMAEPEPVAERSEEHV